MTGSGSHGAPSTRLASVRHARGGEALLATDLLVARRRSMGLSREDVARASGLALTALERLERGDTGDAVTLGQLARVADCLGLDVRTLLPPNCQQGGGVSGGEAPMARDVAHLACMLLVANASVSRDTAARGLGWDLIHLEKVLTALESESPRLGVQLTRRGMTVRLVRTGDWERVAALSTQMRQHAIARATKARTARLVHAIIVDDPDVATAPVQVITEARAGGMVASSTGDKDSRRVELTERVQTSLRWDRPGDIEDAPLGR